MIVVLADDISGAAEVAGVATLYGLTAEVHIDRLFDSDCDVVAIDADTRALHPSAAAEKAARLTAEVLHSQPQLFYKKVDSALRGPIAVELDAMARVMQAESTVLVNSNPRKGRVIRDKCLLIDSVPIDKTAFAFDPEHPAMTCFVPDLLQWENMELVSPSQYGQTLSSEKSVVAVQSESDLTVVARTCLQSARIGRTLLSGAAEFFEALLVEIIPSARIHPFAALEVHDDTFVISGTKAQSPESARNAVGGAPCIMAGQAMSSLDIAKAVCRVLDVQRRAVLTSFGPAMDCSIDASNPTADQAHERLMEVSRYVMANCKPQHVWLEGGRTASGFLRATGCDVLKVTEVYADGVVGLKQTELVSPKLLIKPGSYPWPVSDPLQVSETATPTPVLRKIDEVQT